MNPLMIGLATVVLGVLVMPRTEDPPPARTSESLSQERQEMPEIDTILRYRPWHHEFMDPNSPAAGSRNFRHYDQVGPTAEFMPASGHYQNENPPHITARIGNGGQPDRAEQIAAYNAGTARYSALQSHMDNYGRPMMGFGMGFGFR